MIIFCSCILVVITFWYNPLYSALGLTLTWALANDASQRNKPNYYPWVESGKCRWMPCQRTLCLTGAQINKKAFESSVDVFVCTHLSLNFQGPEIGYIRESSRYAKVSCLINKSQLIQHGIFARCGNSHRYQFAKVYGFSLLHRYHYSYIWCDE